ncbi:MAG: GldM family protein [Cytophagales bacterium]|nr:GldM family protein [Cytophagales bacterium]
MAGGKETPRQKMIGMMYLVLTALLALNVSNAVLEKFAIIDDTLVKMIEEDDKTNERKLAGILGSSSQDEKVIAAKKKAEEVRKLSKATVAYLDELKSKMKKEPDGAAIEGEELVTNTNRAEELMLDGQKPEEGIQFEKTITSYVNDLNKIMGLKTPFPKLTRKAEDFDEFKNNTNQLDKTFLQFTFEGTPTMAAIATVSQLQTEVMEYEAVALDSLFAIAEGVQIKFDNVVPMVRAETNTLVAGQEYNADLFIAAASDVPAEMFFNDKPLVVAKDAITGINMGKIKFRTSGGAYDKNGLAEASYHVKINIKGKPYEEVIRYKVAKPVAKFESESASTLYLECGNEMTVSVQGLAESSGISLSVTGDQGKVIQQGPGKFVLIPKRPQMDVRVSVNGSQIEVKQFKAKQVPSPVAKLQVGNGEYDVKRGIPPGTSIVRLIPDITDDTFKRQNAKDAAYRVTQMTLQITGKTPITLTSGTIELNKYGLRPGDSFSVFNVQVVRSTWDPGDADNKPVNAKLEGVFVMGK